MTHHSQVVLITGCSSGFGLLTAVRLAGAGHRVHATVRDRKKGEFLEVEASRRGVTKGLTIHYLDVSDPVAVKLIVKEVLSKDGVIDVLINNAGYGVGGFFEDLSDEDIRRQFDTNFFGALNVIREVLPIMRPRRTGRIINISSVAVYSGTPTFSAYASSKAALESFSECLYLELKPFSIDVVLVEPGAYRTKIFTDNMRFASGFNDMNSPYRAMSEVLKKFIDTHLSRNRRNPEDVAVFLQHLVQTPHPRFRNVVGFQSKLRCWIVRHIPFEFYGWLVTHVLFSGKDKHA